MRAVCERKLFRAAAAVACALLLAALFGGALAPNDPYAANVYNTLAPPSAEYPLGTDDLGRCILSRLLAGCGATLGTAAAVQLCAVGIGMAAGMLAGWLGGAADRAAVAVIDILLAFPGLILALAIAGVLGPGLPNIALAMVAVNWAEAARVCRGMVKSRREEPFIAAARAAGGSGPWILARHILPHVLPGMAVYAALGMSGAVVGISSMSYIGLGVRPPAAEWGMMLSEARVYMGERPLALAAIIACVMLSVAVFQVMGELMRDALEPRASQLLPPRWGRAPRARRAAEKHSGEEGVC